MLPGPLRTGPGISGQPLACLQQQQQHRKWTRTRKPCPSPYRLGPCFGSAEGLQRRQGQFNTDQHLCEERERKKALGRSGSALRQRMRKEDSRLALSWEVHSVTGYPGASNVNLQNSPGVWTLQGWLLFPRQGLAGSLSANLLLSQGVRVFCYKSMGWVCYLRGAGWVGSWK